MRSEKSNLLFRRLPVGAALFLLPFAANAFDANGFVKDIAFLVLGLIVAVAVFIEVASRFSSDDRNTDDEKNSDQSNK